MSQPDAVAASIVLEPQEERYRDHDLDLDYIDVCSGEVAAILAGDGIAEIAYQPGDGTFYGLVITPLRLLQRAGPRIKDGQTWDAHGVRGLLDSPALAVADATNVPRGMEMLNSLPHMQDAYLVSKYEGTCYAIRLGKGRPRDLAADYLAEHWDLPAMSAVAVAIFLRAVSYHLAERGL